MGRETTRDVCVRYLQRDKQEISVYKKPLKPSRVHLHDDLKCGYVRRDRRSEKLAKMLHLTKVAGPLRLVEPVPARTQSDARPRRMCSAGPDL